MLPDDTKWHFFDETNINFIIHGKLNQMIDFKMISTFKDNSINFDTFKTFCFSRLNTL